MTGLSALGTRSGGVRSIEVVWGWCADVEDA